MILTVTVKTRSKIESLEKISETEFLIRTGVPPVDGKANERIIELLSKHLSIPKSSISLVRGHKSKTKYFKIKST